MIDQRQISAFESPGPVLDQTQEQDFNSDPDFAQQGFQMAVEHGRSNITLQIQSDVRSIGSEVYSPKANGVLTLQQLMSCDAQRKVSIPQQLAVPQTEKQKKTEVRNKFGSTQGPKAIFAIQESFTSIPSLRIAKQPLKLQASPASI